ncbi:MAG: hypothetical protein JWN23_740 [Rhodocyclales bacterium]|nr:hypothetical protein [Rhodocyclales bacterium]
MALFSLGCINGSIPQRTPKSAHISARGCALFALSLRKVESACQQDSYRSFYVSTLRINVVGMFGQAQAEYGFFRDARAPLSKTTQPRFPCSQGGIAWGQLRIVTIEATDSPCRTMQYPAAPVIASGKCSKYHNSSSLSNWVLKTSQRASHCGLMDRPTSRPSLAICCSASETVVRFLSQSFGGYGVFILTPNVEIRGRRFWRSP